MSASYKTVKHISTLRAGGFFLCDFGFNLSGMTSNDFKNPCEKAQLSKVFKKKLYLLGTPVCPQALGNKAASRQNSPIKSSAVVLAGAKAPV